MSESMPIWMDGIAARAMAEGGLSYSSRWNVGFQAACGLAMVYMLASKTATEGACKPSRN